VAHDIVDRLAGHEPAPFHYQHRGELVSLGRHEAVAEVFGVRLKGLPAWIVWRAFYLSQLMGFKNRIGVALDWSFAYFYQRDTVRLDFPSTPTGTERDQEPALNEPREAAPAESAPHAREWAAHPTK
jgi:NADH dehydrogenase